MIATTECRACGARIVWVKHLDTGNLAPLDARPDASGHLTLETRNHHSGLITRYRVLGRQERHDADAGRARFDQRYTNHFQTCPSAERFRKCSPSTRSTPNASPTVSASSSKDSTTTPKPAQRSIFD